jgi:hypothetical protein
MKFEESRSLPPCAMSLHCLRLVDALDSLVPMTDDLQDQLLITQLGAHIPTCPTCKAVLAQARLRRSHLRASLHTILLEGEERVPSTVLRIQQAIRREAAQEVGLVGNVVKKPVHSAMKKTSFQQQTARSASPFRDSLKQRRRTLLRNIAAVAVAAILILAAVGLFNHRFSFSTNVGSSHQSRTGAENPVSTRTSLGDAESLFFGWNSAMMAVPNAPGTGSAMSIRNYNIFHDTYSNLRTATIPANAVFDSIAPDGSDLLYQISQSGHTFYYRLLKPLANTGFFYELNDENAGNAIWMSDSRNILIGTKNMGVIQVDTLTGQSTAILPQLMTDHLEFYHNGYLYFIDTHSGFSRVNITTGIVTYVTSHMMNTSLWYSPDGTKIYTVNSGSGGVGIYAMNLDGTNQQFVSSSGSPVGFAADNSLLIMRYVSGKFQVIKPGATEQQDQLVATNAAPGAHSLCPAQLNTAGQICDNFVAVAPYGHALIVQGTDADGSYHVWLDDLISNRQVALRPTTDDHIAVQLFGWDRLFTP